LEVRLLGENEDIVMILGLLGLGYLIVKRVKKTIPSKSPTPKGAQDLHIFSPYIRQYAIDKYGSLEKAYWAWT